MIGMNTDLKFSDLVRITALMSVVCLFFAACNRIEEVQMADEIRLQAVLSSSLSASQTKGIGEVNSRYAGNIEIGLARIDQKADASVWPSFKGDGIEFLDAEMLYDPSSQTGVRDIAFDTYQTYTDAESKIKYASWYPKSIKDDSDKELVNENKTEGSVSFPIDGTTDIMYGSVATGSQPVGFNTIEFNHALVKYSLYVYAMEPEDKDAAFETADSYWGRITDVIFEDMPEKLVLTLPQKPDDVDLESYAENYGFAFPGENKTDYSMAEVVTSGDWHPFTSPEKFPVGFSKATNVANLLAAPAENGHLKIKIKTDRTPDNPDSGDEKISQTVTIARNFEKGKHYKIILRFTSHGQINAEVVSGDWSEFDTELETETNTDIYYNLSEAQTANCYIVASANYNYCFDATVKGNGASGIMGIEGLMNQYGSDYHILSPKKAAVIWADAAVKDDIELTENIVEGKVLFRLKGDGENLENHDLLNEGNILIGVYSDEARTELLWTWHIWITDRPHEQGYKNGFSVMDRDLGSVAYNPENDNSAGLLDFHGLLYQWGRPTPFPFERGAVGTDGNPVAITTGRSEPTSEISDLTNRIRNPKVFYTNPIDAGEFKDHLWGWRSEVDEYAKTIYDPCPQGYRLPSYKLWRDLVMADADKDGVAEAKFVKKNDKNVAIKFTVAVNNEVVYYPITGYYYYDGYKINHTSVNNEVGAFMWAATYNETAEYEDGVYGKVTGLPYYLDFSTDGSGNIQDLTYFSNLPGSVAMPVRCISRMSKAHVTDLSDYQTANSYIVSDNGYYKFKATVRGNGVGELVAAQSATTIILNEGLDVDISSQLVDVRPLWWQGELSNTADTGNPPSVPLQMLDEGKPDADGYVSFKVENFSEGNMILAGYDVRGNIIWSWHIWMTDSPQMRKSNAYVVMDRYLGATFAPDDYSSFTISDGDLKASYGFYYQWGRKDPFPGNSASWYYYGGDTPEWKSGILSSTSTSAEKTIPNSVAQPTRFHASSHDYGQIDVLLNFNRYGTQNSAEAQCMTVMERPGSRSSLWGYSAASGVFGLTTTKTMYDPCPPGYCVSYYLVWSEIDGGTPPYAYRDRHEGNYVALNDSNVDFIPSSSDQRAGIVLKHSSFDPTWYPYSGYIEADDPTTFHQVGSVGRFHSATPAGLGSRSLFYTESYSGQAVTTDYVGLPSSYAYPVRCQKE